MLWWVVWPDLFITLCVIKLIMSINYVMYSMHTCKPKPSKHTWSDLDIFWLLPVMAIMASVQPELGWILYNIIIYATSNFFYLVQFHSSKQGQDHILQNWSRSSLDGLVRFGPNASGLEASRCARVTGTGSGRMQPVPTTSFYFQIQLHSVKKAKY